MASKAPALEQEEDAAERSVPQPTITESRPFNFDRLLECGATLHGIAVASVRIETADGRFQELSFRVSDENQTSREAEVSRMEARILKVLRDSKFPLTRKQMALVLKLSSVSGRFGQTVTTMVDEEKIYEDAGLYTDEPSKFTARG